MTKGNGTRPLDKNGQHRGSPTKYRAEHARTAGKLAAAGLTDAEIADVIDVNLRTLVRWKGRHKELCLALKTGKEEADARVERSLYERAVGYSHDTVKVFQYKGDPVIVPFREHVVPDVTAQIFWLKNRRPDLWRDVHHHRGEVDHRFSHDDRPIRELDDDELAQLYLTKIAPGGKSVN